MPTSRKSPPLRRHVRRSGLAKLLVWALLAAGGVWLVASAQRPGRGVEARDGAATADSPSATKPVNDTPEALTSNDAQVLDGTSAGSDSCPLLQRCLHGCCAADQHCNVYQCYRPIPCGEGLRACPEETHCDDYVQGRAECARMGGSARERNAEYCERMEAGVRFVRERGSDWRGATGACLPILAPHRLRGRWYRALGTSALDRDR